MPKRLTDLLPTAGDVTALSKEQLAAYILEVLNSQPELASGDRSENIRNYMSWVNENYGKNEAVLARANSAWRWLVDNEFLTPDARQMNDGWYKLTPKGRAITEHAALQVPRVPRAANPGPAPDFAPITSDGAMQKHLHVLWEEAVMCTNGDAFLSAMIMLGSLLEGALLAKCMTDSGTAHTAASVPKTKGSVEPWQRWSLADFIAVAHDCGWIHKTRGEFSDQLREYRNLVHPFRAYNIGYRADKALVTIAWEIVRATLSDLGVMV
jgi:hypothetical protein